MAVRTTSVAVALIVEVDDTISITPFIEVANALVTEVCVPAGYDSTRLELIERWLAAHFYAVRDPRADLERISVISFRAQFKVDLGLSVTVYGQQAMLLDTSGGLAALNQLVKTGKSANAKIQLGGRWLGTDCCEIPLS